MGNGEREREGTGNWPDAVQFTSQRNWLSHGLACTCKDIYYRPTLKVTTTYDRSLERTLVCSQRNRSPSKEIAIFLIFRKSRKEN